MIHDRHGNGSSRLQQKGDYTHLFAEVDADPRAPLLSGFDTLLDGVCEVGPAGTDVTCVLREGGGGGGAKQTEGCRKRHT